MHSRRRWRPKHDTPTGLVTETPERQDGSASCLVLAGRLRPCLRRSSALVLAAAGVEGTDDLLLTGSMRKFGETAYLAGREVPACLDTGQWTSWARERATESLVSSDPSITTGRIAGRGAGRRSGSRAVRTPGETGRGVEAGGGRCLSPSLSSPTYSGAYRNPRPGQQSVQAVWQVQPSTSTCT